MKKNIRLLPVVFLMISTCYGQSLDSLMLQPKEIPDGYKLTKENNCISIQACTFYDSPETFEVLIGKMKTKKIQNFDHQKDKGSIMYFEFEKEFTGESFLGGLLWGEDHPTKEHPEEFFAKGKYLVIWSFPKGSALVKISKEKVKAGMK